MRAALAVLLAVLLARASLTQSIVLPEGVSVHVDPRGRTIATTSEPELDLEALELDVDRRLRIPRGAYPALLDERGDCWVVERDRRVSCWRAGELLARHELALLGARLAFAEDARGRVWFSNGRLLAWWDGQGFQQRDVRALERRSGWAEEGNASDGFALRAAPDGEAVVLVLRDGLGVIVAHGEGPELLRVGPEQGLADWQVADAAPLDDGVLLAVPGPVRLTREQWRSAPALGERGGVDASYEHQRWYALGGHVVSRPRFLQCEGERAWLGCGEAGDPVRAAMVIPSGARVLYQLDAAGSVERAASDLEALSPTLLGAGGHAWRGEHQRSIAWRGPDGSYAALRDASGRAICAQLQGVDARGRAWVGLLGRDLGQEDGKLVCLDPSADQAAPLGLVWERGRVPEWGPERLGLLRDALVEHLLAEDVKGARELWTLAWPSFEDESGSWRHPEVWRMSPPPGVSGGERSPDYVAFWLLELGEESEGLRRLEERHIESARVRERFDARRIDAIQRACVRIGDYERAQRWDEVRVRDLREHELESLAPVRRALERLALGEASLEDWLVVLRSRLGEPPSRVDVLERWLSDAGSDVEERLLADAYALLVGALCHLRRFDEAYARALDAERALPAHPEFSAWQCASVANWASRPVRLPWQDSGASVQGHRARPTWAVEILEHNLPLFEGSAEWLRLARATSELLVALGEERRGLQLLADAARRVRDGAPLSRTLPGPAQQAGLSPFPPSRRTMQRGDHLYAVARSLAAWYEERGETELALEFARAAAEHPPSDVCGTGMDGGPGPDELRVMHLSGVEPPERPAPPVLPEPEWLSKRARERSASVPRHLARRLLVEPEAELVPRALLLVLSTEGEPVPQPLRDGWGERGEKLQRELSESLRGEHGEQNQLWAVRAARRIRPLAWSTVAGVAQLEHTSPDTDLGRERAAFLRELPQEGPWWDDVERANSTWLEVAAPDLASLLRALGPDAPQMLLSQVAFPEDPNPQNLGLGRLTAYWHACPRAPLDVSRLLALVTQVSSSRWWRSGTSVPQRARELLAQEAELLRAHAEEILRLLEADAPKFESSSLLCALVVDARAHLGELAPRLAALHADHDEPEHIGRALVAVRFPEWAQHEIESVASRNPAVEQIEELVDLVRREAERGYQPNSRLLALLAEHSSEARDLLFGQLLDEEGRYGEVAREALERKPQLVQRELPALLSAADRPGRAGERAFQLLSPLVSEFAHELEPPAVDDASTSARARLSLLAAPLDARHALAQLTTLQVEERDAVDEAAIVRRAGSRAVPLLLELLESDSARAGQLIEFVEEVPEELLTRLLELLRAPDPAARAASAHLLGVLGEPARAAVPALLRGMRSEKPQAPDWIEPRAAARALGRLALSDAMARDALLRDLDDSDLDRRGLAQHGLASVGEPIAPFLLEALPELGVRARLASSSIFLWQGAPVEALPFLLECAQRGSQSGHVEYAIERMGPAALPQLIELAELD